MKHKYAPNDGWFACNIKDIELYIHQMKDRVLESEGIRLTADRLKVAIEEDTYGEITVDECVELLQQFAKEMPRWSISFEASLEISGVLGGEEQAVAEAEKTSEILEEAINAFLRERFPNSQFYLGLLGIYRIKNDETGDVILK